MLNQIKMDGVDILNMSNLDQDSIWKITLYAEWGNIYDRHHKKDPEKTRCIGKWPNTGKPRIVGSKEYWEELNKFNTNMGYKHVKWEDRGKKS